MNGPSLMAIERPGKTAIGRALFFGARARRIATGPASGVTMEIDFRYQWRFWLGIFERELASWFRRFCAPDSNSFDVGAREGYYTLLLAKRSPGGRVLAIEADPTEHHRLRRNLNLNKSLRPAPEALLARVVDHPHGPRDVTLDEIAYGREGFVPDLVKLDIEGWELCALRGATRLLADRRPHLIVETHSEQLERACSEVLREYGYAPQLVTPSRGWLPETRPGHNTWLIAQGRPR
jgi:Methyltransferase FkbM domain